MDILEERGIKIPNAVLIKDARKDTTTDEIVEFLAKYGKIGKIEFCQNLTQNLNNVVIVEYKSGEAMEAVRKLLPYSYYCEGTDVTIDIVDLSTFCSEEWGKIKTQHYLAELEKLAKLTGQDFAALFSNAVSLLGQSVSKLEADAGQMEKHPEDESKEGAEDVSAPLWSTSSLGVPNQTPAPNIHADSKAQNTAGPRFTVPPPSEQNPPDMHRYVVEYIVKNDEATSHRLRAFSGRVPRPQIESDYDTWRSAVELLLNDPSVSDLQRSRKIFESLLPPAADMTKHLRADTPPATYLQILDSAYGTVQDGDELYAKFMDTFQDAGEKPSAYLQRLQVALNLAVKRGGAPPTQTERFLLNQFCRGCWDDSLISELHLKQRKTNPPTFAEFLLLLRTEEDREAAKALRMKQHLGSSKSKAASHVQYAYTAQEEKSVSELTSITQQLTKQLADIQKQLASLTAAQSNSEPSVPSKPTRSKKPADGQRGGKPHTNPPSGLKPGYCFRCGEDGHIKPNCDNDPNPSLVVAKRKQFAQKQQKWQRSHSTNSSLN